MHSSLCCVLLDCLPSDARDHAKGLCIFVRAGILIGENAAIQDSYSPD